MPEMSAAQRGAGAWVASGALAPATPVRNLWDQPCRQCGATPTRAYATGRCCQVHTPAALAGHPENRPDPELSMEGLRARVLRTTSDPARYGSARTDPPRYRVDGLPKGD